MNGPELLLADEPTGNLDSHTGDGVLQLLFDLVAGRGLTLLMVTHNDDVAARCSRNVVLRDGLVAADVPCWCFPEGRQLPGKALRLSRRKHGDGEDSV